MTCTTREIEEGVMKKLLGTLILVGVMMLAMAVPASAFEICFGLSSYGNEYKLEVTQFGNTFLLTGHEAVFAPQAVLGTAYLTPSNRIQLGLYVYADSADFWDLSMNASLSLSTLSGPVNGLQITGGGEFQDTLSAISCGGVPDSRGLRDVSAKK
jgi:hypothetical protein